MSRTFHWLVVGLPLMLAACGGGGGGDNTDPVDQDPPEPPQEEVPDPNALSSIGYAPDDVSGLSNGVVFRQPAVSSLAVTSGGSEFTETDITIEVNGVGTSDAIATITIDGDEFMLPIGPGAFTDGDLSLFLDTEFNGVRLARLDIGDVTDPAETGDPELLVAHFVRGYDVDPDDVAARTGTGFFDGVLSATALQDGAGATGERLFGEIDGDVRLFANFDTDMFGGEIRLNPTDTTALESNELTFPSLVVLDLVEAPIEGNSFEGTLEIRENDTFGTDRTFTSGGYDGRFYGLRTGSVGGTFTATIDEVGNDPILLQGGYIADDDVQTGTGRFE